jgi:polysaccharide biosynthesis transport protein
MERNGRYGSGSADDARIDTQRYLGALKRNRVAMALIIVIVTVVVLIISLVAPKSYSASATIVYNPESVLLGAPDAEATQRQLTTWSTLFTTQRTEEAAAELVPGQTADSIDSAVSISVAAEANLIEVKASDSDPQTAADIANAVAKSFLTVQRSEKREQLAVTQGALEEQIAELEAAGTVTEEQLNALQKRANQLSVQGASAGSELQVGEEATVPSSPASPQPVRDTVIAFVAGIFLAVLFALGRDQLSPGLSDPREVGRILRAPVLASIPYVGRRLGKNRAAAPAVEHEAYQSLSASLQALRPPGDRPKVILVTSAVHGEGKSTATSRLGRALAQAGLNTLLISGDLRWPQLHNYFETDREPGFVDVLEKLNKGVSLEPAFLEAAKVVAQPSSAGRKPGRLRLLTSGTPTEDPAALLSNATTESFFHQLAETDYDYVLVDGPPALGVADVQPLVAHADEVILVTRLDRVKVGDLVSLQELLSRFGVAPFGLVVIGANVSVSPYYLGERRLAVAAAKRPINDA